jgi:class 3 adenylate cyclase
MRCSKCGSENFTGKRFCGDCGTTLTAASATTESPTSSSGPHSAIIGVRTDASITAEGERKTVTALFADLKGSTELMRDLDPEEARAIIDPMLKLMIDAVHLYDGYVVQSTGDGIFALFGAPVAHEDHPERALHAAIAMRDELLRRGKELRMRGRAVVEVRIGINTGEVVMRTVQTGGHTEYAPIGHVINLAARMQTVARAGGIVVSENTRHLVEGYFELHELGPTEVKGIGGPLGVYEVVGVGALRSHFDVAARRGLTKFVGRENELQQMKRALELAMSGHGQVVAVVAEAGTGKSRLLYEFKTTIPAECKLLEAYSVSYGKASAWLPVLELLRNYFGIQDTDNPAARRGKLSGALDSLDPALTDTLPYLFALLAIQDSPDPLAQMDSQIKRRRTLHALKRIILRESLNQPAVVIFEDLHRIDRETQALLDLLADSVANSRVLLLVNYRPEYRHAWTNKSYYFQLRLEPLGKEHAAEMLSALVGDGVELAPLKQMVIERTEGNPFFIEELVQALFDSTIRAESIGQPI